MLGTLVLASCFALVYTYTGDWRPCEEEQVIQYDDVVRLNDTPKCDPNCTYRSSGNSSKLMLCTVSDTCENLKYGEDVSICPEYFSERKRSVSFIKFVEERHGRKKHGRKKIALRLKWSPPDFGVLSHTTGFLVQIEDGFKSYSSCYFFNKTMDTQSNKKDEFTNDCFLPSQSRRRAIFPIRIRIWSLPMRKDKPDYTLRKILINVPSRGQAIVEDKCWKNSSVKYSYSIDTDFGQTASIVICKVNALGNCEQPTMKPVQRRLNVIGTLYNLTYPGGFDFTSTYKIFLHGNKTKDPLNITTISFSGCAEFSRFESYKIIIVVAIVVCIALVVVIVCVQRYRGRKKSDKGIDVHLDIIEQTSSSDSLLSQLDDDIDGKCAQEELCSRHQVTETTDLTVFVTFVDDHECHVDVVDAFCTYLQLLGLRVKVRIWERDEYIRNTSEYLMRNLDESDKVLLICSSGTKNILIDATDTENTDNDELREFTAAAKIAVQNMEPTKFIVCYFNYSSEDCIPNMLGTVYRYHYKLMDDFKNFYFHVMGREEYVKGGKNYFREVDGGNHRDPEIIEKWTKLQQCINEMRGLVTQNSTWYNDAHGCGGEMSTDIVAVHPSPPKEALPLYPPQDEAETESSGVYHDSSAVGENRVRVHFQMNDSDERIQNAVSPRQGRNEGNSSVLDIASCGNSQREPPVVNIARNQLLINDLGRSATHDFRTGRLERLQPDGARGGHQVFSNRAPAVLPLRHHGSLTDERICSARDVSLIDLAMMMVTENVATDHTVDSPGQDLMHDSADFTQMPPPPQSDLPHIEVQQNFSSSEENTSESDDTPSATTIPKSLYGDFQGMERAWNVSISRSNSITHVKTVVSAVNDDVENS